MRISWVKGHATKGMIENGQVKIDDKEGNDGADTLAVTARDSHAIPRDIRDGVWLRRVITMITQTMMAKAAMQRARLRKEMAIEEGPTKSRPFRQRGHPRKPHQRAEEQGY